MYQPTTGRFDRLDDFAGDFRNPQSLHKYLYVHGDPINGIDPTGRFEFLLSLFAGLALGNSLRAIETQKVGAGYLFAAGTVFGFASIQFTRLITYTSLPNPPVWTLGGESPEVNDNRTLTDWEENVYRVLASNVGNGGTNPRTGQFFSRAQGLAGAHAIAQAYVTKVHEIAKSNVGITDAENGWFGVGGHSGWTGNFWGGYFCRKWADDVDDPVRQAGHPFGWEVNTHFNVNTHGEASLLAFHSFISATFVGNSTMDGRIQTPDVILDPWLRSRPDVFDPNTHSRIWPIDNVDPSLDH
jgi:hypothetical protein